MYGVRFVDVGGSSLTYGRSCPARLVLVYIVNSVEPMYVRGRTSTSRIDVWGILEL